jgi:hypothetical protein
MQIGTENSTFNLNYLLGGLPPRLNNAASQTAYPTGLWWFCSLKTKKVMSERESIE